MQFELRFHGLLGRRALLQQFHEFFGIGLFTLCLAIHEIIDLRAGIIVFVLKALERMHRRIVLTVVGRHNISLQVIWRRG